MANQEIYDYFSTATPDYDVLLDILAPKTVVEISDKNQIRHYFDDGSDRVIELASDPIVKFTLQYHEGITESDAGIILDFFLDSSKANGYARSFKYYYPNDGHTYVVKFETKIIRRRSYLIGIGYLPVDEVKLKVIGTIAD